MRSDGEWTDYGLVSGWKITPERIFKCRAAGHKTSELVIGKYIREVRCPKCKTVYYDDMEENNALS